MSHKATLITLPSPAVCSARTVCSPRTPYSTTTTRFTTSTVRKQPEQTPIWRQLLTAFVFLIIFVLYLAIHAAWGAATMCLGWKMLQQSLSIKMSSKDLAVPGASGGSLAFLVQIFTFVRSLCHFSTRADVRYSNSHSSTGSTPSLKTKTQPKHTKSFSCCILRHAHY